MAVTDPTGFAVDDIAVATATRNDTGELSTTATATFKGRVVHKLTVTYSATGEMIASPAYAIIFTNAATDVTPASVITTSDGVQEIASISHVRDEFGAHHHTEVKFS